MSDVQQETAQWYRDYYARKGADRNDPFNPGVLFQELAYTKCFTRAFSHVPRDGRIMDFGGGDGSGLRRLIALGYDPAKLGYIDVLADRVERGRQMLPAACTVLLGDASACPEIATGAYDVVTASTMFIQLEDEVLAAGIAAEMVRVCRPGGSIILFDWAYDYGRSGYRALDRKRMTRLFGIGEKTEIVGRHKAGLLPPLGRALSRYAGALYFAVQAIPFATGLFGTVLRRKSS